MILFIKNEESSSVALLFSENISVMSQPLTALSSDMRSLSALPLLFVSSVLPNFHPHCCSTTCTHAKTEQGCRCAFVGRDGDDREWSYHRGEGWWCAVLRDSPVLFSSCFNHFFMNISLELDTIRELNIASMLFFSVVACGIAAKNFPCIQKSIFLPLLQKTCKNVDRRPPTKSKVNYDSFRQRIFDPCRFINFHGAVISNWKI